MSRVEPGRAESMNPLEVEPGSKGPGIDELVRSGEIDEPVPQGMFLELIGLMGRLKARRESMGLSLAAVSERSGLSRQTISRLEDGWDYNPTLEALYRYGLALDIGVTLGIEEVGPEGGGETSGRERLT